MSFATCTIALLCLVSVSHAAPPACEDLVRPLDHPHGLQGRWSMVAGSMEDSRNEKFVRERDSVTIYLHNSSYIHASNRGGVCQYRSRNISMDTHPFTMREGDFNFTVTFLNTSCPDCVVLTMDVKSPNYKSVDMYLLSKRREVDQSEMEEFAAQVECLNMPQHMVKDPAMELCPEQTASEPAAEIEEKADGLKALET